MNDEITRIANALGDRWNAVQGFYQEYDAVYCGRDHGRPTAVPPDPGFSRIRLRKPSSGLSATFSHAMGEGTMLVNTDLPRHYV